MNKRFIGLGIAAACLTAISFGQQYKIYDIGAEIGSTQSIAFGVNDLGQVVGTARVGGVTKAFLWDKVNGAQFLGDLPGGSESSSAFAINNSGTVTGRSSSSLSSSELYTWNSVNGMQGRGLPVGDASSVGWAINEAGVVAGWGSLNVITWDSTNGYVDLGLGGQAGGINSSGQITGISGSEAFFYDPVNGVQLLGDFAGGFDRSVGAGINDSGVVVGEANNEFGRRAFMWDSVNGMVDLGDIDPNSPDTYARAINNAGQVTGYSASDGEDSIFLWDSTNGMRDLSNFIIDNPTGMIMGDGYGINESGSIVGWGAVNGFQNAMYAEAVPEPGTMAILAGLGILAARIRKKN